MADSVISRTLATTGVRVLATLRLEDVALLADSVVLFAVSSLAMWLTRNLHRPQPRSAGISRTECARVISSATARFSIRREPRAVPVERKTLQQDERARPFDGTAACLSQGPPE